MEFAYSAADVERIHKSGKLAALASLEGGHLIADSLGVLRAFHRLGVRYMTLAHFESNAFADSMTDNESHNGLSKFRPRTGTRDESDGDDGRCLAHLR